MKTLGIIGGMGAAAGVRLAQELVQACQQRGATHDSDFPEFILYNIPVVGMDECGFSEGEMAGVASQVQSALDRLSMCGVRVCIIGCNTAHAFLEGFEFNGLLLNMVRLACENSSGNARVGIMASETTKHLRLYDDELRRLGVEAIHTTDQEQKIINRIIAAVISGQNNPEDSFVLDGIACDLQFRGAQALIIGCTELPIAFMPREVAIPIIDAGRAAVEAALKLF